MSAKRSVKNVLKENGISIKEFNSEELEMLEKIEDGIECFVNEKRDELVTALTSKQSVSKMVDVLGFSRWTLYKTHPEVKNYISLRVPEINNALTAMRTSVVKKHGFNFNEILYENNQLHTRDAEYLEMKLEIADLNQKIEDQHKTIERLNEQLRLAKLKTVSEYPFIN